MFIDVSLGWQNQLRGLCERRLGRKGGGGRRRGMSYAFYPTLPHVIKTLVMLLIAA